MQLRLLKENKSMENNNQNQTNKPKYENGEKYQYNRFEDTFGDAGRYCDETPRNEPFHIFSIIPNGKKWKKVYLAIILCFAVFSVVAAIICFLYFNYF